MNEFGNVSAPTADAYPSASATMPLPLCDRDVVTDLSGDFSLPDYQPEIKRLLRIIASPLPPTRYASADGVEINGGIDYFVLYTGNDNRLYCAPLSDEYRLTAPADDAALLPAGMESAVVSTCDNVVDTVNGRVTAPRRLNIRCRLRSHVRAYYPHVPDGGSADGLLPASVETLTDQALCGRLHVGLGDLLPLQDDVILPPGEETRVICAEGNVMITDATAGSGTVNCRGEVILKLTMCPADPPEGMEALPTVTLRKIPFSQAVELVGVTPGCTACAHGQCAELSVEMDEGHLHVDLGILLEVMAQTNEAVPYVRDMYSTRKETLCRYTEYPVRQAIRCVNGNFTLSDSLALSDTDIDPAARVLDVTATAVPEALIADKNRYVLSGKCRCHLLLLRDGEYGSADIEIPFRYEMDGRPTDGDVWDQPITFDGCVTVPICRARMDGERIGIDAELVVALSLASLRPVTVLTDVAWGEDITRRSGEYVICFPAPTDTVWSVAKRYHAPLAPLAAANNLSSADTLDGVGYLIV